MQLPTELLQIFDPRYEPKANKEARDQEITGIIQRGAFSYIHRPNILGGQFVMA